MINQKDFLINLCKQFDETSIEYINFDSVLKDLDEWSSLVGLSVLAMIQDEYGIRLFYKDIENIRTIKDLYDLVCKKLKEDD